MTIREGWLNVGHMGDHMDRIHPGHVITGGRRSPWSALAQVGNFIQDMCWPLTQAATTLRAC
jgi:hypothetical protein